MEPGSIVKAVYDFATEEDGELPLLAGDIVQVLRKVDRQWLYGVSNRRTGNFPSNFVIELKVPPLQNAKELFAAANDFAAQEVGDLAFKKGDLIVGINAVDANWWNGECNGQVGIFPVTHVWRMDQNSMIKPVIPKKLNLRARVKLNMKAQLRAEMDLVKDEIVLITEEVDQGWYRGECNGRSGIFPASFVMILSDQNETDAGGGSTPSSSIPSIEINESTSGFPCTDVMNSSSQYGYDCVNSGITPYGRAVYAFKAEFKNELTFNKGEIIALHHHVDDKWMEGEIDGRTGLFPRDFIEIIVDCPNALSDGKVGNSVHVLTQQPEVHLFSADTYGRVLYDFHPQVEGDIQLKEGDTITLIRKIDQNWLEVITDNGDCGVCPSSFIEVIGSGPETLPPSYSEVMKMSDSCSNGFVNGTCTGSVTESAGDSAKNLRPLSYPPSTHSQFTTETSAAKPSRSLMPASSRSIDAKIAENLLDLNVSSTSSSDSYSTAHFERKPGYLNNCSSDFGHSDNAWKPTAFPVSSSEQRDSLSGFPSMGDAVTDTWMKSDAILPGSFSSSTPPVPAARSSNSLKKSTFGKGETKSSNIATPQRPPPPTVIWPSVPKSRATPKSVPRSSEPPSKPLRRQTSDTGSVVSSDGLQRSTVMQQISEKEERIQKLEACRNKVMLEVESGPNQKDFVSSELKTQIEQFGDEINSLKREVEILKNDLPKPLSRASSVVDSCSVDYEADTQVSRTEIKTEQEDQRRSRERVNKMKEQRGCVITEILQTERDYIGDLKILHNVFLTNPEEGKAKGVDISTLFGNLDEVIDLANRLLRRLQKTSSAEPESQMIGECFVDMAEDMKQVYGHYCRNHDDVNVVLDKYVEKSPGGQYLKHKVEIMKRQTNCFDLPSMLIKPVQRILKYPLLLNELVKCTEDGHPDKQSLIKAIGLMTDVATAINEFKRRKDLVFKYRKHADTSLSGRLSKINIHSMLKKSSRLGMRLSSTIGLRSVAKDEAFEKVEQKFSALEKSIKIFLKDVGTYSEKLEEFVTTGMNMGEDIADLYQERKTQQEVDQFRSAHRIIVTQFWEAFKHSMNRSVITPLEQLLRTYEGPNNLIQKRYDKLLDAEACANKLEKNKDVTKQKALQENQIVAKQMYEALNSQLLDDLPRLCSTSTDVLRDCIRAFLRARKSFVGKTARHMLGLMELPLLLGSQSGGILETFQVKHTLVMDSLCQLTVIPKHLFPSGKSDSIKRNPSPRNSRLSFGATAQPLGLQVPQSSAERAHLLSSYHQSQLYSAYQDYTATDLLDISLKKGDLVGVIKQQDPMGSRLRWFVDKGGVKGFVPAKVLIKYISDSPHILVSQTSVPCSTPLVPLDENRITSVTSAPHNNFDFRRSDNFRHSYGANMTASMPQSSSLGVGTRSLERDKPRKPLQPSRPAPVPQHVKKTVPENTTLWNTANSTNLSKLNQVTPTAPRGNTSVNISSNIIPQSSEPPQYVEIDDNLYDQGRYEQIPDEVPSMLGTENKHQSAGSYSIVPLHEFDPYAQKQPIGDFYDNVPDSSADDLYSAHRYEDILDDVASTSVMDETQLDEYYYSMYDFSPVGQNQLNLFKGQVVLVLHKCDLNGNCEWWFVEDRYQNKGYVPGSYLSKYSETVGHC